MTNLFGKCNFVYSSDRGFYSSGIINVTKLLELAKEFEGELFTGKDGCKYIKYNSVKLTAPADHNTHSLSVKFQKNGENRLSQDKPVQILRSNNSDDLPF